MQTYRRDAAKLVEHSKESNEKTEPNMIFGYEALPAAIRVAASLSADIVVSTSSRTLSIEWMVAAPNLPTVKSV